MAAPPVTGDPFWHRPAPLPPARPPRRVDVLVAGAGITGLALLHHLRRAGIDAVAAERAHVGAGASGRNAGFLLTGTTEHYAAAVAAHGRTVAREAWAFTAANHDLLLDMLGEAGAALAGHRRIGAWTLAGDETEVAGLREAATLLAEDGLPGRWVAGPAGAAPGVRGGLLMPADGEIDPAAMVGELASRAVEEAPGCVVEGTAVLGATPHAHGVRVVTSGGDVEAGELIVALNAWSAELVPSLPIRPVRAQMLATAAPPRPPGGTAFDRPAYSHHGHRYWRRLPAGELLLGGCRDLALEEEVGTEAHITVRVQDGLDAFLHDELGSDAAVTTRWAGIMGFSPDGLPLVGPVPGLPHVHVCGGYTGHGLGFAASAARVLVRHLRDGAVASIPAWLRADRPVPAAP